MMTRAAGLVVVGMLVACGGDGSGDATSGSGGSGAGSVGGSGVGGGMTGGAGGTGAAGAGGGGGSLPSPACDALPAPTGATIEVGPDDDVVGAVAGALSGSTILLEDGTYDLTGTALWIQSDDVTLRSKSGDAAAVILEGGYDTSSGGLVNVGSANGVTVAEITIQHPRYHAIHVTADQTSANGTLIYGVRLFDPGEQAIKINHHDNGAYADAGEIACSRVELTAAGRQQVQSYTSSGSTCYTGGVDAHGARDWVIRDNTIVGFWCETDLSEHGIHLWTGSRDTVVERNLLVNNARGIGFGLTSGGRAYPDDPCGGIADASHYGGHIANNFVVGTDPALFNSPSGMDLGIGLWHACGATVVHNTVASTQAPFASIEGRFAETTAEVVNNLVTHDIKERDGASLTLTANLDGASDQFVDLGGFDLHLTDGAPALGAGHDSGATLAPEDIDGDPRTTPPDVGADQR